jgi:hypothetical protein
VSSRGRIVRNRIAEREADRAWHHPQQSLEEAWPYLLTDTSLATHLSASTLTLFMRCPEQFRQVKILGKRARPGHALIQGHADHKAQETNFRQKIQTRQDLPLNQVKEAFSAAWDAKIEQEGGPLEVEWGEAQPGKLKDQGVELAGLYHQRISPLIQPVHVEREITLICDQVPVPVQGYVDVETERSLIERKTSATRVKEPKPDWLVQARIYQAALAKPVEWHVSVKTGEILTSRDDRPNLRLETSDHEITEYLIAQVALELANNLRNPGPDKPWKGAVTHPWACNFCGFKPDCFYWQ